ncbi:hypothetical protein AOQ84DRAFT_352877 [Glonium stellatum]|uniref:Uncharacterized protein n=1 Tax=Glonium stellatum TaxID=574774 RepID=A0A8E2F743_9PEZI|nr:hypothetical protein AOQ84DRAFT_352877 [Glonium stellatum]
MLWWGSLRLIGTDDLTALDDPKALDDSEALHHPKALDAPIALVGIKSLESRRLILAPSIPTNLGRLQEM